jgi:integrase/recombinase XerD
MNAEDVRRYLLFLRNERKLSWSAIQGSRAALRFLYVRVLKQRWFDDEILSRKRHPKLPTVLSAEEVSRILDATRNLKHWTILAMLYATGIRASERHLKAEDIDKERMVLHIRHGKGQVPRDLNLSPVQVDRCRAWRESPRRPFATRDEADGQFRCWAVP